MKYITSSILILIVMTGCLTAPRDSNSGKILYDLERNLTTPVVSTPVVQREVLDNGLRLVLMERKDLPVIHAQLSFVHGGSAYDTENLAGLASLTSSLLEQGTITKTAPEIAEILDMAGAGISTSCTKDTASVSLDILSDFTEMGLELFAEIITQPLFSEPEIMRMKQQVLSSILGTQDQLDTYATELFSEYVYKGHPYHRPVQGYEATIPGITREDITGFHKKHYVPDDGILIVVGNFDTAYMVQKIKNVFKDWKPGKHQFVEPGEVNPHSGKKVILFDKDVTQSTICIGHPGFKRMNPDFYSVLLLNQILGGGGLTSRVGRKVRTEMGLAYSVSTYFISRMYGGSFLAFTQTRNENAHLSVQAILGEMNRIRNESVPDEELRGAKSYYNGSFPLRFETNSDFAQTLFFIEMYDMGLSYFKDYLGKVNETTKEELKRVAQKYIHTDDYIIVAITKADEVIEYFKEFGEVEVVK